MGKKTNWTLSEDQALCRAWLCASDAALAHATTHANGEPKATTFWGVVHQLFHAELETSVDRPITGLKIRWTRINRDVQRFAIAFARAQSAQSVMRTATSSSSGTVAGSSSDATAVERDHRDAAELELERERHAIDDAADQFSKDHGNKFAFESCWRLLRFSPRWMQLLANSAGMSAGAFHAAPSSSPAALLAAEATAAMGMNMGMGMGLGVGSGVGGALGAHAAAAIALQKRRLGEFLDTNARAFPESSTAYLAAIAHELARQSDLMEEQNAIALFRMELDAIDDDAARDYFVTLRHTYSKRMRRDESTGHTGESTEDDDETRAEIDAAAVALRDGKETADL